MFFQGISYITVIVAAALSMGLGFIWYSPYLFGKKWIVEMGSNMDALKEKNQSKTGMFRIYGLSVVTSIITAYILASIFNSIVVVGGLWPILSVGFFLWLGFMVPVLFAGVLFGNNSYTLFAINAGYQLTSILLMSFVIGIFS